MARSDVTDAQPDQFSFNFMGYSGKFILDRAMTPVLLEFSNLKIEYTIESAEINSFKVTAPDGVQYFFNYVERTNSTSNCNRHGGPSRPTAWYLSRVLLANGEEITFQYAGQYIMYNTSISQIIYSRNNFTEGCVDGNACPTLQPNTCTNSYSSQSFLLSRIDSRAGSIAFEYIDRINANTGASLGAGQLLKKITVFDPGQQKIKSFTLDYQHIYGGLGSPYSAADEASRSFLTGLNEHDRFDAIVRKHQFEYNNIQNVPARLSFAQDHWGYYNGQYNYTLIPLPKTISEQLQYPDARANREPNADATATGLLKKVIYPTGGYEQLEYEANTVNLDKQIFDPPITASAYAHGVEGHTRVTTTKTFTVAIGQEALLTVSMGGDPENLEIDWAHNIMIFTVSDGDETLYSAIKHAGEREEFPLVLVSGHTYTITTQAIGPYAEGNAFITYTPGTSHTVNVNENVGGVRVKNVITAASDNEAPVVKFYYYGAWNNLNKSSGAAYTTANVSYMKPVRSRVTCALPGSYRFCNNYALYSNSLLNMFIYPGNIQYRVITESIGGPDFENGGIQHLYTLVQDYSPSALRGDVISGCPYTNASIYSGKEKETYIFNKDKLAVEKRVHEYTDDATQSKTFKAYAANLRHELPPSTNPDWPSVEELDSYNCSEYQIWSRWIYKSRDSVYKYDQDGNAFLSEVQEYEFKNPQHALPTQTVTYASNGEKKITTLQYPIDYTIISNKTPFQSKFDLISAIDGCEQAYNQSITAANATLVSLVCAGACCHFWRL
jgi:hypothetical protein